MYRTAALFFFLSFARVAHSQLVINEVGIAPTGGNGSQFVELFNRSGCTVDLSCYTLIFSSTSGGGNPTGWTIKIPSGKSIAGGGYFLIGGTAGTAGVSGGTGYPTGGIMNSYVGVADINVGTTAITTNAVYMKQGLSAGNFSNTKGQLSLLDAAGNLVASVSYNSGNNAGTYPLSAYTTCAASGNAQGVSNIPDPGASVNNVPGTFSAATNQGLYLSSNGTYLTETSLTPGASNAGNGGTQICSGPVLNAVSNTAVCFDANTQTVLLPYSSANAPATYTLTWDATSSVYFSAISNATLGGNIHITIPANTPPGTYTGYLRLSNVCGNSCTKPFTLTVNVLPSVNAGSYAPVCTNSSSILLNGTPAGGTFTGTNVTGSNFIPPDIAGNYTIAYAYTDALTGCSNNASTIINVSAPTSTYTTACTNGAPFVFFGQLLATTGLHTVVLNNAAGCADTARIYLVVRQSETVDITACDSVLYNGIIYRDDANLTQGLSSVVVACDSVVKNIRIHIKRSSVNDTTVCLPPSGSFVLLGQTFTSSGHYVLHTTNAEGCDSVVRLHLTIANTQVQTHSGCDSVWLNGQRFYASTVFSDTLYNQQGCDSMIQTHNVVINHSLHTYLNVCRASGQAYNFNGQVLNASGDYTATLNGVSCDSIVHLHLLIAQRQTILYQGCNRFTYNGVTYVSSTTLTDTLRSTITGCDSILRTIQILIQPVLHTNINACIQQGQTYFFNNQTLTTGGYYTAQLTTHDGCDSIVHLYLTVAVTQTQNISGCDSLFWHGQMYYVSSRSIDTVRSLLSSCDSLYRVTNITITASPVQHLSVCLAAGQSYSLNGQSLNSSGQYIAVFVRPGLCDSTVHIKLVITSVQQQTINGCGSVVYNGTTYTSSTVLRDTLRSVGFCDSVYRIVQINVLPTLQTFATACINQGQSYLFNGQTLTVNGYYLTTYQTTNCDSTVQLYLTVTQTKTQTAQGCDSVMFKGRAYFSSTVVRDTIRSLVSGCDSLITITTLTVYTTKHQYVSVCLQPGQTYNFNGQLLTNTGSYQTVYTTSTCDSIVRLYLVVAGRQSLTLKGCSSIVYNGITYTSSTIVSDTVKSRVTSCDSLYREVNILIASVQQTFITACIVPGNGYLFNGQWLTATGNYAANFMTATGCDSLVNLYLVVSKVNDQAVSGCDSVVYKGTVFTTPAVITDTTRSAVTHCDSIINVTTITVNKKPSLNVSRDTIVCRWGTAVLNASSPGALVNWTNFGNPAFIVVSPQSTTQYFASAVDTNGCKNTKIVTVFVEDFSIVLRPNINPALSGTNVLIQSSSNLPYSIATWQPANLFRNQTGKSQRFAMDTSVNITAVGQSSLGCRDTATLQLIAIPLDDVYIPSAFTPNGDGRNDEVKVMGTAINEIDFKIFNRWGQMVFHTTDKSRGWNGMMNGTLQPTGTYVYTVRVKKASGQVVEKKGIVTLIK